MIALLLILDSLGTSELLVILVVALIFFGPRKLPQLSRHIGKSLAEFRKASEDFKRTWEREVALETTESKPEVDHAILPRDNSIIETTVERSQAIHGSIAEGESSGAQSSLEPASITSAPDNASVTTANESAPLEPTRKRDWL